MDKLDKLIGCTFSVIVPGIWAKTPQLLELVEVDEDFYVFRVDDPDDQMDNPSDTLMSIHIKDIQSMRVV